MPTYVLMSTLTPHGRETMHTNPDRLLGVNQEVERFGCRVLQQYALLGPYDFLTIIDAPDSETVAHLSIDLGSRGTVNIATFIALDMDVFRMKLKGPEQLAATPVIGGENGPSPERTTDTAP